jgi:hypothetical protein
MTEHIRWDDGLTELLDDVEDHLEKITQWHWTYGADKDNIVIGAVEYTDRSARHMRIATISDDSIPPHEASANSALIGRSPVWLRELCKRLRAAEAECRQLRTRAQKSTNRMRQLRSLNRMVSYMLGNYPQRGPVGGTKMEALRRGKP